MSKQLSKLLHIATIGKTVGLKGDMKLHIQSDFPEQFKKGSSFFIDADASLTLSEVNLEKGIVKIAGCSSPEEAKKFTNKKLYTTLERTRMECHLEDGEHFWFDIEGCSVVENGKVLGIAWTKSNTTTSHVRIACGTLACAACTLLSIWLASATAYLALFQSMCG